MTVSIIVAVKGDNPNLRECIEYCLRLDYLDFEILVLPDKELILNYPKTRAIPTGELTPPQKRDIGIAQAQGEILAFLDDDTYPAKDWLTKALRHFKEQEIAAVGGPGITAESDNLRQKASGLVYSSWLMSGQYAYRYIPKKKRFVDDFPSCNFLIRKSVMQELGGFKVKFWPGEDTFLCLKIIKDLKKKIIYDPDVLVYHHRRSLFKGHLKQIANYAAHRGYFVKRFSETSLRFVYFLPSMLVFGLIAGPLFSFLNPALKLLYILAVALYLALAFVFSISKDFRLTLLVFWGIIFSHILYGLYFIKGLLSQRLKEE
jgi:GT2 family glycosyltransferase